MYFSSLARISCVFVGFLLNALMCFSLVSNTKRLLSVSSGEGVLDCVHGIRFFSMTWVILGHTYFFLTVSPVGIGKILLQNIINSVSFCLYLLGFCLQTMAL